MYDMTRTYCQFPDCKLRAAFGINNTTHCSIHKLPDMWDKYAKLC